jgi:nicotinamide riboside kinase
MNKGNINIVVTGPESTGKTELALQLAASIQGTYIREYAREYIESLDRPYRFEDVEHIAEVQRKEFREATERQAGPLILDTYLVITRIWFSEVFGNTPDWIIKELEASDIHLFLLCYHDIEWVEDPVRENPGKRREYLYELYKTEIEKLGITHEVISGKGQQRVENALDAVFKHFPELRKV